MAKSNLGDVSKKLFELLEGLSTEDQSKVIRSALALLGNTNGELLETEVESENGKSLHGASKSTGKNTDAKAFFKLKDPKDRGEQLAVAARYLEENRDISDITKEDFESAFDDAKRNFDSKNFARDINNAKHNAKLFISGSGSKTYKLSFYGEEYVDALPDREKAEALKPSGKAVSRKKKGRKKSIKNQQ